MSNTLTNLLPDIYDAIDVVSREQAGMIPSVLIDSRLNRVAVNQTARVPITPAGTAEDISAGTNPPDTGDQTIDNVSVTISNQRAVPFRIEGEEEAGLNSGVGYENIRRDQIAQAIRTLVNEVEEDLCELYTNASRAFGTAGTTPFATKDELDDLSETRRILMENGAPKTDLQMVLSNAAMAKMGGFQSTLWKVNEAGTDEFRQNGIIGRGLQGFAIRETNQAQSHTKGTGTSYQLAEAGEVGETALDVDTGTGTIVAGDVVTFAGTTDKYIVGTALSSGTFSINKPGLLVAEDDNDAITIGSDYDVAGLAFHRNAIVLAARLPYLPTEGDAADDVLSVTDPMTGLTFEFAVYKQFRRIRYQVGLAWGVAAIKPEHIATLLG